jgi:hypothetical protein
MAPGPLRPCRRRAIRPPAGRLRSPPPKRSDSKEEARSQPVDSTHVRPWLITRDLAVRWYLRFGLSYRDLEELLAERGVEVDHVTIYRWVLRFTPLLPTSPGHADLAWEIAGKSMRRT